MFDPKTPTERESFAFDFEGLVATGETLDNASVTVHVIRGEDPAASSMVGGAPVINGTKVSILLINGVNGVIYCVKCQVNTSAGQRLELTSDLLVREPC